MRRKTIITVVLVPMLLLGGCLALSRRTTVPEVERKVDQAIPVGSSRQEVETWLTGQGIKFSSTDSPKSFSVLAEQPDIDKYPTAIVGLIRDTDYDLLVSGSIQLYFLFGPDGRLEKRLVRWIGTGP